MVSFGDVFLSGGELVSILIKGMEMPSSCYNCDCCVRDSDEVDYCCLLMRDVMSFEREEDCPLVEIPPHGRLIDGDYLKQTHCEECTLYPDKCLEKTADGCDWGSITHLRMCPTIIPADKDGDVK